MQFWDHDTNRLRIESIGIEIIFVAFYGMLSYP
jgi:hypothetical protein